jgi:hypothetical protein
MGKCKQQIEESVFPMLLFRERVMLVLAGFSGPFRDEEADAQLIALIEHRALSICYFSLLSSSVARRG